MVRFNDIAEKTTPIVAADEVLLIDSEDSDATKRVSATEFTGPAGPPGPAGSPTDAKYCIGKIVSTQSIPDSTETKVLLSSFEDNDSLMEDTNEINITVAGVYTIIANIRWNTVNSASFMTVYKNGGFFNSVFYSSTKGQEYQSVSLVATLAIGDKIDMKVYHEHGSNITLNTAVLSVNQIS